MSIIGENTVIKERPLGGTVEKHGNFYRKSGPGISDEIRVGEELYRLGFPVPEIVEVGDGYFVETEIEGSSMLEDPNPRLSLYKGVLDSLLRAQLSNPQEPTQATLESGIHLPNVLDENPELARTGSKFKSALNFSLDLSMQTPWSVSHGDLTPPNIFPGGIIDWQFSFKGPVFYDILSLALSPCIHGPGQNPVLNRRQVFKLASTSLEEHAGFKLTPQHETVALFLKSIFFLSHMKESAARSAKKQEKWGRRKEITQYLAGAVLENGIVDTKKLTTM